MSDVSKPEIRFAMNMAGEGLEAEARQYRNEQGLAHLASRRYPSDIERLDLPEHMELLASVVMGGSLFALVRLAKGAGLVAVQHGTASVEGYGETLDDAVAAREQLALIVPESQPGEDQVRVTFWSYGAHGPSSFNRPLDAATWDEVRENYTGESLAQLTRLLGDGFVPGKGGQLLLWSGPAGTGKTNALRALAREWKDWCSLHYIVDPENFFGQHSDYLMEVLIGGEKDEELTLFEGPKREPWRLLVLEDSGELLHKDASERVGKALARLLNTVDGLVGQGLRVMVLITTNEEVAALHEAIARPGRCAMQIGFESLGRADADEWREDHGLERTGAAATLAELYAELHGFQGAVARQPVGF